MIFFGKRVFIIGIALFGLFILGFALAVWGQSETIYFMIIPCGQVAAIIAGIGVLIWVIGSIRKNGFWGEKGNDEEE
jgi:hypothetical protein